MRPECRARIDDGFLVAFLTIAPGFEGFAPGAVALATGGLVRLGDLVQDARVGQRSPPEREGVGVARPAGKFLANVVQSVVVSHIPVS